VSGAARRAFRAAAAGKPEEPRPVPASCPYGCGRIFSDASLVQAHGEHLPGGSWRCFPEERLQGQLVLVDGVYTLPGSDRARGR
jgi:hypothetical protein